MPTKTNSTSKIMKKHNQKLLTFAVMYSTIEHDTLNYPCIIPIRDQQHPYNACGSNRPMLLLPL